MGHKEELRVADSPSSGGDKMPKQTRFKTDYPGVYFVEGKKWDDPSKAEKIYYIFYRKDGKKVEEKAGRQHKDAMTPARANNIRSDRIRGKKPTNKERRLVEKEAKEAQRNQWTIDRLWEEYKKQNAGNEKTRATDDNRYKNHIKPVLGSKEPPELRPLDVERLKKKLKKKNPEIADATVANTLEVLRRIVNFGVNMQLTPPISFKIKLPKLNNEKTENLTENQLARLHKALDEEENLAVATAVRLALSTGMRRGEIFKLKWKDIDFERGFITLVDPKGGKDEKIQMNEKAREILENYPRSGSPYVFPSSNDPAKPRVDMNKTLTKIKKKAKLPKDFRMFHGQRHTFASKAAEAGYDLHRIGKLLGHKSSQMTQRYAHLRDEALKQTSNEVANAIFKEAAPAKQANEKASDLRDLPLVKG